MRNREADHAADCTTHRQPLAFARLLQARAAYGALEDSSLRFLGAPTFADSWLLLVPEKGAVRDPAGEGQLCTIKCITQTPPVSVAISRRLGDLNQLLDAGGGDLADRERIHNPLRRRRREVLPAAKHRAVCTHKKDQKRIWLLRCWRGRGLVYVRCEGSW
jgi:hypothetical protein